MPRRCVSPRPSWSAILAVPVVFAALALSLGPDWGGPVAASAASSAKPVTTPAAKPEQAGPKTKNPESHGPGSTEGGTGQGIVQSVSPRALILRELDGGTVTVPVVPHTRVFVDGKLASLRDVKPGFVAVARWKAGKPARVLHTFDLSRPNAVEVAVVESVTAHAAVVTDSGGSTVTIPVNSRTRVLVDGKPAALQAVKTGDTVVIMSKDVKGKKPASELRFLRPG